jgi:hypothetical protein
MKTCEYDGPPFTLARSHPWTDSVASAEHRYYDLKATPSLIRTSLEDFVPWSRYAAIGGFYSLLEWLNGELSPFESNDCAFAAPHANDEPNVAQALTCSGRVMLLFRDLPLNASPGDVAWLKDELHRALGALDVDLELGLVGTTVVPVRYLALPVAEQAGEELMVSFWAWGDTEAALMGNLERVVAGLFTALRHVAADA